jgi:hypothetical protein
MILTIDTDEIANLVEKAQDIYFSESGEQHLLKLLDIQDMVEEAVKSAKSNLENAGLQINPNFKSIAGSRVKVSYRFFGDKYKIYDESMLDKSMVTSKVKYAIDSDKVEKYEEEKGQLPMGITLSDRAKTISFRRLSEKEE